MKWDKLPKPYDKDFRYFLVIVWKHLQLPNPTPIQLDIAGYMQNGQKRRIIEAFRGVGKSWMAAAYTLWLLRNCLLYTSPSPRDGLLSRMPSSA